MDAVFMDRSAKAQKLRALTAFVFLSLGKVIFSAWPETKFLAMLNDYCQMITAVQSFLNKHSSIILGTLILTYLILRVVIVPICDDEYLTYQFHVHNDLFTILTNGNPDIYWSSNNHILNTLFIKLSFGIFGEHDWAFRIHILLAFIVCYYFIFKILSKFVQSPLRITAYLGILFLNPYLLDFFSIARGYALSMAGWSAAMYYFNNYYQELASIHNLRNTIISLFLAIWSNFSAIYFLPLFGLMFLYHFYQKRKKKYWKTHLLLVTSGFLLIIGIVALPLYKTIAAGLLIWGKGSFFQDSFVSSVDYYMHYNSSMGRFDHFTENWSKMEVYAVVLMAMWTLLQLISLRLQADGQTKKLYFITLFQGLGLVVIVLLFHALFGTAYPYHRTALLFTFPFLLALFLSFEIIITSFEKSKLVVYGMLLFCIWHSACSWNVENTMEWYLNGDAKRVFSYIENVVAEDRPEKKIILGAEQWQYFSMAFYAKTKYKDMVVLNFTKLEKQEKFDYLFVPKHLKHQVREWDGYRAAVEFKHGILYKAK